MDPSMNTEPERSMYQLVANSPVLKIITFYLLSTYSIFLINLFVRNEELFTHEVINSRQEKNH